MSNKENLNKVNKAINDPSRDIRKELNNLLPKSLSEISFRFTYSIYDSNGFLQPDRVFEADLDNCIRDLLIYGNIYTLTSLEPLESVESFPIKDYIDYSDELELLAVDTIVKHYQYMDDNILKRCYNLHSFGMLWNDSQREKLEKIYNQG